MNTKDLNIGSFVLVPKAGEGVLARIKELKQDSVVVGGKELPIEDISPVEICEEALVRMGFKEDRSEGSLIYRSPFCSDLYLRRKYKPAGWVINKLNGDKAKISNLRFLHQLQQVVKIIVGKDIDFIKN